MKKITITLTDEAEKVFNDLMYSLPKEEDGTGMCNQSEAICYALQRMDFLEKQDEVELPKEGEEVYVECHFKDSTHRAIEHGTGIGDDPIRKILLPAKEEEAAKIRYDMAVEHWHSLTKNKLKGKDESERQGEIVATFIECLKIAAGL
jgi:hypothetical protein